MEYDESLSEHYRARGGIEPIDFIESNNLGAHEANIVKYVTRWPYKGGVESLVKARWWLNRLIAMHEAKPALAADEGLEPTRLPEEHPELNWSRSDCPNEIPLMPDPTKCLSTEPIRGFECELDEGHNGIHQALIGTPDARYWSDGKV